MDLVKDTISDAQKAVDSELGKVQQIVEMVFDKVHGVVDRFNGITLMISVPSRKD